MQALSDGHYNYSPQDLESTFHLSKKFFPVFGHRFFLLTVVLGVDLRQRVRQHTRADLKNKGKQVTRDEKF